MLNHCVRWTFGLLILTFLVIGVDGYIEIVEEQRCHNSQIRLTCRELDAHIAVLEAWYTSLTDYYHDVNETRAQVKVKIRSANDTELDKVYEYASPTHNGVYELVNSSLSDDVTDYGNVKEESDVKFVGDSFALNDTADILMEFLNASEMCTVHTYTRKYVGLENGTKRWPPALRGSSINLLVPLRNRCNGASRCSFIVKKTRPAPSDWSSGFVYLRYSCLDEMVEEQRCHNSQIRLTCRKLDAHIAVLEAWYTSLADYYRETNETRAQVKVKIRSANDTELDKVYVYASPTHNGVYELVNSSLSNDVTDYGNVNEESDVKFVGDRFTLNDTADFLIEFLNASEMCSVLTYSRRYVGLENGTKRWHPVLRGSSINLLVPLRNRCNGASHCSFVLKKTHPAVKEWSTGFIYLRYSCLDEIVEEQRCDNSQIRLTCRELDAHIAVLEAWYTSLADYYRETNETRAQVKVQIRSENDTELDKVYVYASPTHNGVYELVNSSLSNDVTDYGNVKEESDVKFVGDGFTLNDTADFLIEFLNASEMCSVLTYSRRYVGLENGTKRWHPVLRGSSINLLVPLRNRCNGASHCSFILKKTHPAAKEWSKGFIYLRYSCLDEIVEEQRCHNSQIRLTCRELDAHIAVLEAWYTSLEDYYRETNETRTQVKVKIRSANDIELDKVYLYTSPSHNGVYELVNSSLSDVTDYGNVKEESDLKFVGDSFTLNDTADVLMEFLNASEMCSVLTYSRRYVGLENVTKRRHPVLRGSSINLLVPLRNRCNGASHCSFILKKTHPGANDWSPGFVYLRYSCLNEIVEEQRCHDEEIRLTCRELDTHIAVLEAWYTSMDDFQNANDTRAPENITVRTENDSELDRVYVYSSPKQNGVYELTNHSTFENYTDLSFGNATDFNDTKYVQDVYGYGVNDTVDVTVEFVNTSDVCGAVSYTRSYASWRDGEGRRRPIARSSSVNLRAPLSYRCTGVNHCNFLLEEDYPPAVDWPLGVVSIKYACFDDSLAVHYCNREVIVAPSGPDSEGYIRTPGYPHFYVGDECRWRLKANREQRIRVSLLDVSLRSIGPFEPQCTDYVSVIDSNGESLLSTCEQVDLPVRLISTTDTVEVIVEAKSQGAFPKRGVLLHYKSIGCVTLPAPSDGYLVYRNEDVAHYKCNVNFVFADTRQRALMLWCFEDNRWNGTVPLCIEETAVEVVGNDSSPEVTEKDTKLPPNEPNMIVDIVIPSLLIAALFIGNAFIVLIIYKYRKRKTEDLEDEFNTIPLSSNGGMHNAGNAV